MGNIQGAPIAPRGQAATPTEKAKAPLNCSRENYVKDIYVSETELSRSPAPEIPLRPSERRINSNRTAFGKTWDDGAGRHRRGHSESTSRPCPFSISCSTLKAIKAMENTKLMLTR